MVVGIRLSTWGSAVTLEESLDPNGRWSDSGTTSGPDPYSCGQHEDRHTCNPVDGSVSDVLPTTVTREGYY